MTRINHATPENKWLIEALHRWMKHGFTRDESVTHQRAVDQIMFNLKNNHDWLMTATREEMEQPLPVREYMEKAIAERDDRQWRENLHQYLHEIATARKDPS